MSIIRSIKARLGLSVTPANNFVLDASADNGTMKLARESGQDIMTVDAAGKVAFPQGLALSATKIEVLNNAIALVGTSTNYLNAKINSTLGQSIYVGVVDASVTAVCNEIVTGGSCVLALQANGTEDYFITTFNFPTNGTYLVALVATASGSAGVYRNALNATAIRIG